MFYSILDVLGIKGIPLLTTGTTCLNFFVIDKGVSALILLELKYSIILGSQS